MDNLPRQEDRYEATENMFRYREEDGDDTIGIPIISSKNQSGWKYFYDMRDIAGIMRVEHEVAIQLQARLYALEQKVEQLTQDNVILKAFYDAKMSWDSQTNVTTHTQ